MKSVYDVFLERGFIEQITDEALIQDLLHNNRITCYAGFDPTAVSLHIGSLVPIMAIAHMQRQGHRPIVLVGGGTGLIGDPSGKSEMRHILKPDQIAHNTQYLEKQLSRYVDFNEGKAVLLNNADWLADLKYVEFLRDIGRHFSVNRMLAAESYRIRLEKGLNFIEFNYMLLQAYDFLYLFQHYDCVLQMGGNDQWGNMLAGADLIRRVEGKTVHCMTFPLLTTSLGHKMGKTETGAVWLDPELTSPYEYYQYWINTDDADVERFLALFTFLPMEEIRQTKGLANSQLNMAKAVLAFEATKITHGEDAAIAAWKASSGAFKTRSVDPVLFPSSKIPRGDVTGDISAIPSITKTRKDLEAGIPAFKLFHDAGLCGTSGEARRVIAQGGGYVNEQQITSFEERIGLNHINDQAEIRLRKGKKKYFIIKVT
ncbi:MAG: tyrosine--tRNA ligase [Syntrophaceae bacterium CG2_30_49_12]|nr:MAG: tyrosine--tRNA ligase [Syntrophaceae bacterium CG2_30_49_12]PIP05475.1 MAG: tyrosine--tRNA ligase [Syntrophobacterales bacterium CG23_combo_of_CG06-09_8_20_14_all_48_27]PJA50702.1 MAG: tyrosine--tRNA ligase [Syntrophobacterales bacterium CG_4_9_14_3_um_filter_49_8]PJC75009.1 MAG: tyrosine--tRNA ligase [Syntrophobacterales bacterium CG_4_8_14_3_um_filter_49_14]